MRRLLKLLHTLGAAGLMGAALALAVTAMLAQGSIGGLGYVPLLVAMARITAWIIGPSMVVTVISGLLAIVAHSPFQNAGWVWIKAATGILLLEGGLHVMGPIQDEAKRAAAALAYHPGPADAATLLSSEVNTLWVLLAVSAANVALGVWRPRMPRMPF